MYIIMIWLKTEDIEVKKAAKGKKKIQINFKVVTAKTKKKKDYMIFPQSKIRRKKYISEFSKKIINGVEFCVE